MNCTVSHIFYSGVGKMWHFKDVLCATFIQYLTSTIIFYGTV